jgi:cytochrome c biogenesis protein CcdA
MATDQLIARLRRAMVLDVTAFEEARDDETFTAPALGIASGAVLIAAIGTFLWSEFVADSTSGVFVDAVILGTIFLLLLWAAGIAVTYAVLTQAFRENAAPDALVRVMALGHVPFVLGLLVFIPGIGFAFGLLSVAMVIYYTIYGITAAFPGIDPRRVLISVVAGFAVWAMILPLLTGPADTFAPGVFIYEVTEDVVENR